MIMKNIILLILAFVLAIVLTLAALWFLFYDFEWGHGFWEILLSLISAIILLASHIGILVFGICGAAWYGVYCMWKKVFEEENTNKAIRYTKHSHYSNISDDYSDMHGSNEDKSYLYDDYAYLCDDDDDV